MNNLIATIFVSMILCVGLSAQKPTFWGNNHPTDTHSHTNGKGHNGGHNGWGYGHHKTRPQRSTKSGKCDARPVPEPMTMSLLGLGGAGLAMARRRRRNA